jgi:amidase
VERYLNAGLIPIATTTTPEFGLRLVTESKAFGATRNPWAPARTTGGSSGGSAALVAAGAVPFAHATDGGGSIRVPAACNGLVGLKPSRHSGALAADLPRSWFGLTVFHAVSRSVRDSAALLDITHGAGVLKANGPSGPRGPYAAAVGRAPEKLRLGLYRQSPLGGDVSPETNASLALAVALAQDAGHAVAEIDLPVGRPFFHDFAHAVCAAMASILHAETARVGGDALPQVERATRTIARFGGSLSPGETVAALDRLNAAAQTIITATQGYDGVIMPLLAHPPVPVGAMDSRGLDNFLEEMLDRLGLARLLRIPALLNKLIDQSFWFTPWPLIQNVTGQPAIALPVSMTADNLPLGVQFVGRPGGEEILLSFAAQMEKQSGWLKRRVAVS